MSTSDNSVLLPNGEEYLIHADYTDSQAMAVILLVAVSSLSLTFVILLLSIVIFSFIKNFRKPMEGQFVRTHVAAYFVSLLLTDLLQAIGSIMNARWVNRLSVDYGDFCTAQGAIKQAADVGTATWTFIIAVHTFNVLFLRLKLNTRIMFTALVGGWCFIGAIVIAGPATLNTVERGPYFGISGIWCWISPGYPIQWITLDYMILFISAISSFILYTLVFLNLRGNILVAGSRIRFRRVSRSEAFHLHPRVMNDIEERAMKTAKHMLLYPIAYTFIILPIACTRFTEWTGHTVPFGAVIFTDVVYLLSGFVNASLFLFTRRILPLGELLPTFIRRSSRFSSRSSTLTDSQVSSVQSIDIEKGKAHQNNEFDDSEVDLTGPRHYIIKPVDSTNKVSFPEPLPQPNEINGPWQPHPGPQPDNEASPTSPMSFGSPIQTYRPHDTSTNRDTRRMVTQSFTLQGADRESERDSTCEGCSNSPDDTQTPHASVLQTRKTIFTLPSPTESYDLSSASTFDSHDFTIVTRARGGGLISHRPTLSGSSTISTSSTSPLISGDPDARPDPHSPQLQNTPRVRVGSLEVMQSLPFIPTTPFVVPGMNEEGSEGNGNNGRTG